MTSDIRDMASFARELMAHPLPAPVAAKIRELTLDQIGLQLAGAGGVVTTAPPEQAAYVNAWAGRHANYDDYCPVTGAHVGAVVVPPALAVAQQVGASGGDAARAMAAGGEVLLRVASAGGNGAPVGAAVTAGLLLDLDRSRLADAIGLAITVEARLNSYDRRSVAWAAASGTLAAHMAGIGPTGDGGDGTIAWETGGLGESFLLERQAFKKYACDASVHAAVDAVLALIAGHSLSPNRISHVQVGTGRRALASVGQTTMKTALALTLLLGVPTTRTWRAAGLSDAEVSAWTAAIHVYEDEMCTNEEGARSGAVVTVFLAEGSELRVRARDARGTAENPMTDAELRSKFLGHAIPEVGLDRAIGLDTVLSRLHQLTTIEPLTSLLSVAEPDVFVTT